MATDWWDKQRSCNQSTLQCWCSFQRNRRLFGFQPLSKAVTESLSNDECSLQQSEDQRLFKVQAILKILALTLCEPKANLMKIPCTRKKKQERKQESVIMKQPLKKKYIYCSQSLSVSFEHRAASQKQVLAQKRELKYNEASRKIPVECQFFLQGQHCY